MAAVQRFQDLHQGLCILVITDKVIDFYWNRVFVGNFDDCWIWYGAISPNGYGVVRFGKTTIGAHRLAWILAHGEVPEGLFVLHRCDVRKCVNPHHLFLGTHQDNMDDMKSKGRQGLRSVYEVPMDFVYKELLLGTRKVEIADLLGVSLSTLHRRIRASRIISESPC